jgi:hypothetical protein
MTRVFKPLKVANATKDVNSVKSLRRKYARNRGLVEIRDSRHYPVWVPEIHGRGAAPSRGGVESRG